MNLIKKKLKKIINIILKIRLNAKKNVKICESSRITNYGAIILESGSEFQIGSNSLFEGQIITYSEEACVKIGSRTFIGGSLLSSLKNITIGDDVLVSWGCTIMDHNSHSTSWSKRKNDVSDWMSGRKDWTNVAAGSVIIQNKVWIGANVIILKNVIIGEGCIVGAGSVVTKSFPAWSIIAGNPAKLVKIIPEDER